MVGIPMVLLFCLHRLGTNNTILAVLAALIHTRQRVKQHFVADTPNFAKNTFKSMRKDHLFALQRLS
jgi:hypothetical protein